MERTALLSVFNKAGIVEFAKSLSVEFGFKLLASGGTAKVLKQAGLQVKDVAELVGGGPILGHRVVTLSREVHAGLLAKDNEEDRAELKRLNIPFIDLVCVDLYPLEAEIVKPGATRESVIEQTDIGGPTMLRSAAKGGRIVISDLEDRDLVLMWLRQDCYDKDEFLRRLGAKAELTVAKYCAASAAYHSKGGIGIHFSYPGLLH